jgi:hypothetical protein
MNKTTPVTGLSNQPTNQNRLRSTLQTRSNTFNSLPDYPFWLSKEVWLLPDSAKLLCGRDPMSRYPGKPIYNKNRKVIEIIDLAFEATKEGHLAVQREALLPNHIIVTPKDFIYWASTLDLEIPDELKSLCVREPTIVSETNHEILKERVQTAIKVLQLTQPSLTLNEILVHEAFLNVIQQDQIPDSILQKWANKIM